MTAESGALSETTEAVIKVNGAELFYQLRGSGPALLMIHGTGADSGSYDPVAERLAADSGSSPTIAAAGPVALGPRPG